MFLGNTQEAHLAYDRIADEYARRIYDELRHKPLDCQLLKRFADSLRDLPGVVCDLGCGPGQIARYLHGCGVRVYGIDLSDEMLTQARRLNPEITFERGDMRSLPVENGAWAGIAAFYSIVNLPPDDVAQAVKEMHRVLITNGRLLLSFHVGDDNLHLEQDVWGLGVALETTLFRVRTIAGYMRDAGLEIEEIVEREPYGEDVEYQSRRAYIFAQKAINTVRSA
jgi:SAM-dependent methyltransferase